MGNAKLVIGDRDLPGAEQVVEEIRNAGGFVARCQASDNLSFDEFRKATCIKCDVTVFDHIVALYELAMKTYGGVDVVIPNAGVNEVDRLGDLRFDENGKPKGPQWRTIQINLVGVFNSKLFAKRSRRAPLRHCTALHLAQHYLLKNSGDLKAVVLLGSIAIPGAPQYSASKHGVLGLMRSLHPIYEKFGIRIAAIHPFFADTGIIPLPAKIFLTGIPLVPVPRIAGAITYAATNPNPATSGCAYLLTDNGPVFKVPKEEFKLGVYGMIDTRKNALLKAAGGILAFRKIVTSTPVLALLIAGVSWVLYGRYGKQLGF
ncbi:hypothetical protein PM082_000153 [Marasmius tenuissimus]|nr:hypothetical protein PM082_000153 [Marasmius tenuissimus]